MSPSEREWEVVSRILDAAEVARSARVCYEISTEIARLLGWQVESGFFTDGGIRVGHYWNRLPDGTILDATHDQFEPDRDDPVRIVGPADPAQADYEPTRD